MKSKTIGYKRWLSFKIHWKNLQNTETQIIWILILWLIIYIIYLPFIKQIKKTTKNSLKICRFFKVIEILLKEKKLNLYVVKNKQTLKRNKNGSFNKKEATNKNYLF